MIEPQLNRLVITQIRLAVWLLGSVCLLTLTDVAASENQLLIQKGKNSAICIHFLDEFNGDLAKGLHIYYQEHPEFAEIKWSVGRYVVGGTNYPHESTLEYSVFDLNNDGLDDLVLRKTWTLRSRDYDYLYAARVGELDFSEVPTIDAEYLKKLETIAISPVTPFRLRNQDGKLFGSIYLSALLPFIYADRTYVAVQSKSYVLGTEGRQWTLRILVVEYMGDIPSTSISRDGHEEVKIVCSMHGEISRP